MPDLGSSIFSQTDANNNSGTMPSWSGAAAPSTLDDAGRALQGAVTREWNWRSYTLTAGGTADAKTLTFSVAPAAYYNGQRFAFIANTTNTTSATLNVNGLGAKTIKSMATGTLTNLSASNMVAGEYVEVAYNLANDCFVWVNQSDILPQALGTGDSPQFTAVNIGHASDTTITRSAAGVIAVEGGVVTKENRANTFSANQRVNANIGIGMDPSHPLDVTGLIRLSGALTLSSSTFAYSYDGGTLGQVRSGVELDGANQIATIYTAQNERVRVDASGNVGIGGSPSFKLDVLGNSSSVATVARVYNADTSANSYAGFEAGTGQGVSFGAYSYNGEAWFGSKSNHPLIFLQNNTERMRIDASGNVLVTSSGGLGYGTGSGGSVTQVTSKTTGVTLNKTNGQITTTSSSIAANSSASFTVTNSTVAATDNIIVTRSSGGTGIRYTVQVSAVAAGSFDITIINNTAASQSDVIVINFAVIKSVTS